MLVWHVMIHGSKKGIKYYFNIFKKNQVVNSSMYIYSEYFVDGSIAARERALLCKRKSTSTSTSSSLATRRGAIDLSMNRIARHKPVAGNECVLYILLLFISNTLFVFCLFVCLKKRWFNIERIDAGRESSICESDTNGDQTRRDTCSIAVRLQLIFGRATEEFNRRKASLLEWRCKVLGRWCFSADIEIVSFRECICHQRRCDTIIEMTRGRILNY